MEFPVLQQSDKAAPKPKETGGAYHRLLHELVGLAGGADFAGNFEHFMQFLRLRARHPVQLGVGDRHCAKPGKRGDQRFFFLRERSGCPRINQNCAVRTRRAERRRNQRPCRQILAEVGSTVYIDRNALARADRPRRDLQRRPQIMLRRARANDLRQMRRFRRDRLQLKEFFVLHKNQHGRRLQNPAETIGNSFRHRGCFWQTMHFGRQLDQNGRAAMLLLSKLMEPDNFECTPELRGQDR